MKSITMEFEHLKKMLEAVLFVADKPLSLEKLQSLFPEPEQPTLAELTTALELLAADYQDRGVVLQRVATGYRFQAQPAYSLLIAHLLEEKPPRYSRALLETLALIAYRQPITRAEIESVRGVNVATAIMKTLLERGWVRVVGHRDVPGKPSLYATTREFLDYFNLKSLDELPTLGIIEENRAVTTEHLQQQLEFSDTETTPSFQEA